MSNLSDSSPADRDQSPKAAAPDAGSIALATSPVFAGVVVTQFLGAFNDNYFKQMLLLQCVEFERETKERLGQSVDLQPYAMVAFALPFVLLSGLGGFVSDRFSRQRVIVLCKVGEIVVMSCALLVLLIGDLATETRLLLLIAVLALMGGQSALFGPSKYGILPELFSRKQLLPVNGAVQMTTFLAIIFGMALAGIALDVLRVSEDSLWYASVIAVGIAIAGTLTSLLIRRTDPPNPELRMRLEMLFVPRETWRLILGRPMLRNCLIMAMLFWFIGGVTQPAVNSLGELAFGLSKTRTSLLAASIGVGIALGCIAAGTLNRKSGDGSLWVKIGGWMIVVALALITVLSSGVFGSPVPSNAQETILTGILKADSIEWFLRAGMFFLGFSAGVFVIPIQVYIQQAPPLEQKGRVIGALNLLSWIGIVLSAVFVGVSNSVADALATAENPYGLRFLVFAALALVMLPGAMLFRLDKMADSPGVQDTDC
ncbi:MAG: MFS transporter [Planctomycetaceae bacterium]|jgi:acyl-[acyl-carrier-protein]-phospholipid O-acyltransferase/long-chain-fatty-acid--[acyl-carrier-protein] ligase